MQLITFRNKWIKPIRIFLQNALLFSQPSLNSQKKKLQFDIEDGTRIDDTPMHEGLREALVNCLVNADYFGARGIVITRKEDSIIFENPGYSRTGKKQMIKGGISDPRNRGLMKMFSLINIGERAGSGVPRIFDIWEDEEMDEPTIDEIFDPDRTTITLPLTRHRKDKEYTQRVIVEAESHRITADQRKQKILEFLKENGRSKCSGIAGLLNLSTSRTRAILSEMTEIETIGENRNRTYRIKC
ncbi:MAG: winged helix-turn-helix transcriptional regulator [Spirochaetales bacterium]|nr:winged helix-turn-helix transcriptional regulator [Candidatus Physcosoma equi]